MQCKEWSGMGGKIFVFCHQIIWWNANCEVYAVNEGELFCLVSPEYALRKSEMWNACFSRACINGMQSVEYKRSAGELRYFYCSIECTDEVLRFRGIDLKLFGCVSGRVRCVWDRIGASRSVLGPSWNSFGNVLEACWSACGAAWRRVGASY